MDKVVFKLMSKPIEYPLSQIDEHKEINTPDISNSIIVIYNNGVLQASSFSLSMLQLPIRYQVHFCSQGNKMVPHIQLETQLRDFDILFRQYLNQNPLYVNVFYLCINSYSSIFITAYNKNQSTPAPWTKLIRREDPFICPNTTTWSKRSAHSWHWRLLSLTLLIVVVL